MVARIGIGRSTVPVRRVLLRPGRRLRQAQLTGVVVRVNGLTYVVHRRPVRVVDPAVARVPPRIGRGLLCVRRDLGRHPRHHGVGHHRRLPAREEAGAEGVAAVVPGRRVVAVDVRLRDAAGKKKCRNEQDQSEKTIHGILRVKDHRRPETAQRRFQIEQNNIA